MKFLYEITVKLTKHLVNVFSGIGLKAPLDTHAVISYLQNNDQIISEYFYFQTLFPR